MIFDCVDLKKEYKLKNKAYLECFSPTCEDGEQIIKPALIVVPGGGYGFVSKREGDPIALYYLNKGYNCFVLTYTVGKVDDLLYPNPQFQLTCAFDYVKRHHKKYNIDPNKIYLMGFSAGGHLVGSYSLYYKEYAKSLNLPLNLKPSAICLSYPVITFTKLTHGGSMQTLCNGEPSLIDKLSIEKHVSNDYPPTFIWTTKDDTCVPYENTLMMDEVLTKNNIKHKTMIFEFGDHGLSRADALVGCPDPSKFDKNVTSWLSECDKFFKSI